MYETQYGSATACYYEGVQRTIMMCALLVACDQGAKPEPPKVEAKKVVENEKEPTGLSDPLAMMPANADLVVRLDVATLRRTSWWKQLAPRAWAKVAPELATCDYDVLGNIATLTAGVTQLKAGVSPDAVIVLHGIDREKTMKCVAAKRESYAFVDAKTLVMVRSKDAAKAKLETALRDGSPLRQNASYMAIEKLMPRDAHVTVVMPSSSKMLERSMQAGGMKLTHAFAFGRVDQRLDLDFTFAFNSAEEATQVASMLQKQVSALKNMFDKIDARAVDTNAQLRIGMTEAQVTQMANLLLTLGTNN